jgi:hypothetical protein
MNLSKIYECLKSHFEPISPKPKRKGLNSNIKIQDISNDLKKVQRNLKESLARKARLNSSCGSISRHNSKGSKGSSRSMASRRRHQPSSPAPNSQSSIKRSRRPSVNSQKSGNSNKSAKKFSLTRNKKDLERTSFELNQVKKDLLKNKRKYEINLTKLSQSKFGMLQNIRKKAELLISEYERSLTSSDLITSDRIAQVDHAEYIIEMTINKNYKLNQEEFNRLRDQTVFFTKLQNEVVPDFNEFDIKLVSAMEFNSLAQQASKLQKIISQNSQLLNEDTKISSILEDVQKRNIQLEGVNSNLLQKIDGCERMKQELLENNFKEKQDTIIEMDKLKLGLDTRDILLENLLGLLGGVEKELLGLHRRQANLAGGDRPSDQVAPELMKMLGFLKGGIMN